MQLPSHTPITYTHAAGTRITVRSRDGRDGRTEYDAAIFEDGIRVPLVVMCGFRGSACRDIQDGHELFGLIVAFMGNKEAVLDCTAPRWVVEAPHAPGCIPDEPDAAFAAATKESAYHYAAQQARENGYRLHGEDATGRTYTDADGFYRYNVSYEPYWELDDDTANEVVYLAESLWPSDCNDSGEATRYPLRARPSKWRW